MPHIRPRPAAAALVALATAVPLAVSSAPASAAPARAAAQPAKVVNAYFADWDVYARGYFVKDIPAAKLTHITYAFGSATADGLCAPADAWADYQRPFEASQTVDGTADTWADPLLGNYKQILELKAKYPHLKVNIALGGWTLSTNFSDVAKKSATRKKFVASCIDRFIKGNLPGLAPGAAKGVFDGIDLDWEYPGVDAGNAAHFSKDDRHNATQLLREFRSQLDDAAGPGTHYELTAALPATSKASQYWELEKVARTLDFVDLMTYDFHGGYEPFSSFNSPFTTDLTDPNPGVDATWSTTGTVAHYLANGVPASKIVVGTPFYGKQYIRVGTTGDGLYSSFDNTGLTGDVLTVSGSTTPTYREIVDGAGILKSDGTSPAAGWVPAGTPRPGRPTSTTRRRSTCSPTAAR
ncbi:glycoside hydrolase family 18 protein [Motilibacter peucedani]|uniref:glycoside hydrolase family 18 protein n=1 Tax=Motilibacter peucedani TaxID=598650 RepID=UPI00160013D3|nr:glycoside hydrolase family 18 protein [Motilibacter peucedani]